MEVYLDHPDHGAMVVYSPAEAKLWEPKGWKVREAAKVEPLAQEPDLAPEPQEPEPEAPRRGRPRKA